MLVLRMLVLLLLMLLLMPVRFRTAPRSARPVRVFNPAQLQSSAVLARRGCHVAARAHGLR